MIYVVTGQPRHGKSQYVIKMIQDLIKQNDKREENGKQAREIYCDIAGINAHDTPTKLPSVQNQWEVFGNSKLWFGEHDDKDKPGGYICPTPGAVFIYDECHKVDWIKDSTGALSKNPTTISMNEHGHEDFIFILITQFPQYIHTHLRGLVEYHFHVKRFSGLKQATIYKWNEFKSTPRAKASISDVFEKETFRFNKKYYKCYKSASAHDSMKFKIPKEWALAIFGILLMIGLSYWRYSTSPIRNMVEDGHIDVVKANKASQVEPMQLQRPAVEAVPEVTEADLIDKYLPPHIVELSKSEEITPTAIIANDKKCWALNKYGERLIIDESLCRLMSKDSTMIPKSRSKSDTSHGEDMSVETVEPIVIDSNVG